MLDLIWFICTILVYGLEAVVIITTVVLIFCIANKINPKGIIDWLIR